MNLLERLEDASTRFARPQLWKNSHTAAKAIHHHPDSPGRAYLRSRSASARGGVVWKQSGRESSLTNPWAGRAVRVDSYAERVAVRGTDPSLRNGPPMLHPSPQTAPLPVFDPFVSALATGAKMESSS